jgi:hypothetical protein
MIRCGGRSGRIARIGVCVVAAAAAAAPAAASAQSAVEEYSLDIPGGGGGGAGGGAGGGGTDSGTPSSGAPATGATATAPSGDSSVGGGGVEPTSSGGGGDGAEAGKAKQEPRSQGRPSRDELEFGGIHDGGSNALDTNSRSAPEVVADTLLDGAMLPILAALVLITGFGAWRVLRSRGTLTGHAG